MAASGSPDYQAHAMALALLVGAILVIGSLFRLGWIANLLSTPVTTGFLAGISVHILVSQMPGVLGLPSPARADARPHRRAGAPPRRGQPLHGLHRLRRARHRRRIGKISAKIPGALIGLIAATAAVIWAGLESKGVNVVGTVPGTLPTPSLPESRPSNGRGLLPLSFLIAIVVMVQTAATTRSFPSDPDKPADVDRDFLGAGAGSVLAGLFGAFPVNASPPRTGIVAETGGRSQLSGLFAAAIVLALLAFGATLLQHVPNAALGGVLLFVALRIIRVKQIVAIYRQSFGEFLLIVATAAAIIVLPIEQGVAVGIALSLLHGIWSTTRARLIQFDRVPDTTIWWPCKSAFAGRT